MKLNYVNLGCGAHFHPQWVNVDFSKTGEGVISHNLLAGVPFNDNEFDVVYHSHVLEHFQKRDAISFINECYRILKPGGIIRIAIPDLEQIVNNYLRILTQGKTDPDNEKIRADYDWMLIEMYDQTVRDSGGGEMLKFLSNENMLNEAFMIERIGHEGAMLRKELLQPQHRNELSPFRKALHKIKHFAKPKHYKDLFLRSFFSNEYKLLRLARFKQSGEIHQWMYDIYSISHLLKNAGFKNIEQMTFNTSHINNWQSFTLDEFNNKVRKPDSLFVEAVK
jgi:predicted SAM-dependent methyltransferase